MKIDNKEIFKDYNGEIKHETGLNITFTKKFLPNEPKWRRAYYCIVETFSGYTGIDPILVETKQEVLENILFPIEINLICGCQMIINKPKELRTKKCKHKNYLLKIEERKYES